MTYLFYGTEEYFIRQEIEKIQKQNNIEELAVSRYDLEENTLKEILEDANTVSLFGGEKLIIVTNANIFTNNTKKNNVGDEDVTLLESYLEQMNPDVQLVFVCEKVNMTKKISKLMKKVGVIKEFSESMNKSALVKEFLDGYQITSGALRLLLERVQDHTEILKEECIKLRNYKWDEREIKEQDVLDLVHKNIDLDIFKLIDCIIKKDKEHAMEVYNEMLKYNEEPIKLIIMLSNQFRLMYQAKTLIKKGYREQEIAKQLNVHPYPVKLALEKARVYPEERLLTLLSDLADLDYQIKSGKIEKELGLDLFIMGL